jgi:hypothetical protein
VPVILGFAGSTQATRAIDVSSKKGQDLLGNKFAGNLAKGSAEVLFDAPIPAEAITLIK